MLFSMIQSSAVSAKGGDGVKRQVNLQSGRVSFVGPENGRALSASRALGTFFRPRDPAMALANRFAPEFGLTNPAQDLSEFKSARSDNGHITVRYQQNHNGVPVMGGELIVNTNDNGDLYSISGEVSPNPTPETTPTIDSAQAVKTALEAIAKWYQSPVESFIVSEPELWIYDESLLLPSTRPVELVWRMEVTAVETTSMPVREFVLVDAHRGGISLHFNQVDTTWKHAIVNNTNDTNATSNYMIKAILGSPPVDTYTANNGTSLPGIFLCDGTQPNCTNGSDPHADSAHKYAIGTYNLYATNHLRDSIDNAGLTMISTVHYDSGYANAFWDGTQMVYGDAYGFPLADDVVAHELTHGVTQYESNLFYYYQSGAINESFSDLWGEYYDQTNGQGNDTDGVKWLIGEDISGYGAIRSMSDPPAYGDPDKISSPNYSMDIGDNGGVHHNSGINNKAAYLMVQGGSFNGKTVTALGWEKTGAIYYEVQTNLLVSGADYSDLYYALQQACSNLIGQHGITAGNCVEVKDAIDAVEMNGQPAPNFNTDAPLCTTPGTFPIYEFYDNIESGTSNWTFTNGAYTRWQIDSPFFGIYAHSGVHSLYADDAPAEVTDAQAELDPVVIPANAFLHFTHAYDFEFDYDFIFDDYYYWDGGVLEYSTNGGLTWIDAGSLIDYNGYNGTIYNGVGENANPLSGRSAFADTSHGYISSRLDLSSLAGETVAFRWRMGLDAFVNDYGWWIDDVRIYTCAAHSFTVTVGGNLQDSYDLDSGMSLRVSYQDLNNGPLVASSTNSANHVDSTKVLFKNVSFSEMLGFPTNLITNEYWFPVYQSNSSLNSQLRVGNLQNSPTTINVYIGNGTLLDSFSLAGNEAKRFNYTGNDDGPLHIVSTATNVMVSMRYLYDGLSYSEELGYPDSLLTTEYWFPWYNNSAFSSELRVANTGASTANVTVYVGNNVLLDSFSLGVGQDIRKSYNNLNDGPLRVVTSGSTILPSIKVLFQGISYSEMLGIPTSRLTNEYWMPVYDSSTTNSQIRVGNLGGTSTTITVYVGSNPTPIDSFSLGVGEAIRKNYDGTDDGPLHIVSSATNILASVRIRHVTATFDSYYELMMYPHAQLTTEYVFPWYNNYAFFSELRIGVP